MLPKEEIDLRDANLAEIISILSSDQEILSDDNVVLQIIDKLKQVYTVDQTGKSAYRHEYSRIFGKMKELKDSNPNCLEILGQNIGLVYEKIQKDPNINEEFFKCCLKLYDHINLEIARMNYVDNITREIQNSTSKLNQNIKEIKDTSDSITNEIEDTKQEAKKLRSKLDKAQQETITILGIFSAVVLAFMGGMSFSSSVLESMYLSNVYKVSFICLLIGLVLVNLIYVLFTFIMHINKDRPFKWNRVIIVLDLILIGFMVVDLVAWAIDIKSLAVWIQKSLPWII
ncbi:MAG: hypothetical protein ACLUBT_08545 [[Clostridium] leptum]